MERSILPIQDLKTYNHLVRLLRQIRPDVVHTHSSKGGILGRWAAHRAKVPVIVHTIHGLAFTASTSRMVNAVYRMLEKQTAQITTKIVGVADAMTEQSLRAGIGTPRQYVTVYSGMETAPFINPPVSRDETRRRYGIADQDVVVGTIARLFHLKGHDDLLALAPKLCARHPSLRFMFVGDGLLRQSIESEIARLGLRDRFILTGLVPPTQIPELTAAMDILVHPSRREGLARAIVQGQLAGIPSIAYDIDGNREGLVHERTGYIMPPFEREELGMRISRLVEDARLRRGMGTAGRAFARGRFDAEVMVDALDRVYTDAATVGASRHR